MGERLKAITAVRTKAYGLNTVEVLSYIRNSHGEETAKNLSREEALGQVEEAMAKTSRDDDEGVASLSTILAALTLVVEVKLEPRVDEKSTVLPKSMFVHTKTFKLSQ
jgi:hypothetical protein